MASRPKARDDPWLLKVVKVDSRHRLSLPTGISEMVRWIGDGAVDCRAYVAGGGVSILSAAGDELHGRLAAALSERPLALDEATTELGDIVRYAASSWRVNIDRQFRLTLPGDARKLGLVPGAGERAAVFACGDVLEVWPAAGWREHVNRLNGTRSRFIDEIEER